MFINIIIYRHKSYGVQNYTDIPQTLATKCLFKLISMHTLKIHSHFTSKLLLHIHVFSYGHKIRIYRRHIHTDTKESRGYRYRLHKTKNENPNSF